jgi:ectoine hydroxylase-related dioxygenase (phytanoyl-CoA dioxygenase family)
MFTLPGQIELLDDQWLDRARRFLERELPAAGARPFTLTEVFSDAPPHLGFPDDVASWTLRWDGTAVTVERGTSGDADVVVEGDYQAALTASQHVGFERPGGAEAAWREVVQQYGKDAVRVRGHVVDAAVTAVLARLHDHLARRTVENPDIHHRATRQGLADHVRHMEEHGYAVIERAISADFADEIRAETLRTLADHGVTTLNWMLYQGRCFELLAQQPQLLTLVDASLGRGAVIGSFSAIRKGPGPGTIPLHTDYAHVPEPYPEWAMTGVGVWAFEDWTEASGPTWIVPGSHRLRRGPKPGEAAEGGIPIEMPKGSVVFFTEGVWHWQGDRSEPGERVTLHWHFNRGILRSLEPKKSDEQLLHRNAPRLGEMLGQHDWFDKMSGIGRDHEKFGHMLQLHSFTKKQLAKLLEA